jgi:hypothetical protein
MNETTEQTPPKSESIINEDEQMPIPPQSPLPFPEQEINLNEIFPEEENDLNDLFPDEETRTLLKKVQRNKKDLHTMTDRFTDEDWGGNALTDSEPSEDSPTSEDSPAAD